jgi:glutamate-1-semialdehyde 2,1-aminomutase
VAALPRIADEFGRDLNVHGFPMAFHVSFGRAEVTDWRSLQQLGLSEYARFSSELVHNGLWVTDRGVWYVSAAHGPPELTETQERFEETLRAWTPG